MNQNLEYWVMFSFEKMRRDGAIMATIVSQEPEMSI